MARKHGSAIAKTTAEEQRWFSVDITEANAEHTAEEEAWRLTSAGSGANENDISGLIVMSTAQGRDRWSVERSRSETATWLRGGRHLPSL